MNERNFCYGDEPQSDYEAIDTSLFGWWKAKYRKSHIRKVPICLYSLYNCVLILFWLSTNYELFNVFYCSLSDPRLHIAMRFLEEVKDGPKCQSVDYRTENPRNH